VLLTPETFVLKSILLAAAMLAAAGRAIAGTDEAKTYYMAGLTKERSKDYGGAIPDFKYALQKDPTYDFARKQLGNCFYYLGQYRAAITQYDLYLADHPEDDATRRFVANLRGKNEGPTDQPEFSQGDGGQVSGGQEGPLGLIRSRFYAGLNLGDVLVSTNLTTVTVSGFSVGTDVAFNGDGHIGYQWQNGLALELGEEIFVRAATFSDVYGDQLAFGAFETAFCIEPLYRFPLSRRGALLVGIKLGLSSATAHINKGGIAGIGGPTANSTLIEPDVRYQFLVGRMVGLEAGLEYRSATFTFNPSETGGEALNIDDSGLVLRIGVDVYFGRIIN
jgi:tetratricopeptide (TPR) repeat protein